MKIKSFSVYEFELPLAKNQIRKGLLIKVVDEQKNEGWGEVSPLPNWSQETLKEVLKQLKQKKGEILKIDWKVSTCLKEIAKLNLFPSVVFGLESALLSIFVPLNGLTIATSALLMGSLEEILMQADLRYKEGYLSAKLKVSSLSFEEAAYAIYQLKDKFHLRIDVNRAWNAKDSLQFFSAFPVDAFDYIEEPCQNPSDFIHFLHPIAVDESFPQDLSLSQLASIPNLKAVIYKPTIQGGMLKCLGLCQWTVKNKIVLVLSSSFESDLGLAYVATLAYRLSLSAPVGIGTFHHLKKQLCLYPLLFNPPFIHLFDPLVPNLKFIKKLQLINII